MHLVSRAAVLLALAPSAALAADASIASMLPGGPLGMAILAIVLTVLFKLFLTSPSPAPGERLPPVYKEGIPFIGALVGFAKNPLDLLRRGFKSCGSCFTIYAAHKRLTFLVGPEAHAVFFNANDEELDQAPVYKLTVPIFGKGVVYDAPLDKRLQQLRFLSINLNTKKMTSYVPLVVQEVEDYFSSRWGDEGEADLAYAMSEVIIFIASRCLLGKEVRENLHDNLNDLFHKLDGGMQPISFLAPNLPTKAHRERDVAHKEMVAMVSKIIARRRASSGPKEEDFLQALIDANYKDGSKLSDLEVTGMLVALLFAGQHTSSVTSTWTGMFLLRHKAELAKARAEVESVVGEGEQLTFETIMKLDYLYNCIKETLRMYPPLIFLMREVVQDRHFNGITIPAGDTVMASTALAGRLDEIWTNPNTWDPSRFEPERAEHKKAPLSFISFGGGRHSCLGESFAFLQIRTIWATLLRNYDIEAPGDLPAPNYDAMVVGPRAPCTVRYKRKTPLTKA